MNLNKNNNGHKDDGVKDIIRKFIVILTPIILITLMILAVIIANYEMPEVKYTEFLKMVENKKINEIVLDSSPKLIFTDKEGKEYITDNPRSTEFKEKMLEKDISVVEQTNSSFKELAAVLLALVFRIVFIMFIYRLLIKMQLGMGNDKMYEPSKSNVKFADIAGNNESKKDMELLVEFLNEPEKYKEIGATLPKGVLFYGSPGTGKTLTAKAIAGEAGVPFLAATGSDFVELYAGMGAKKVRKLFEEARKVAPCIVFIDEIDALAGQRGVGSNSEKDQTINALLSEMDGFSSSESIIVIGATNRIDTLDPAVLRAGRFDRHIAIELPDLEDRKEILSLHASNKKMSDDIDIDELAKMTIGFSGASLSMLLNESAINAVNNGREEITLKDVDEAYIKIITKGHIKENNDRTMEDTELVAYHEAGHALLAKILTNNEIPKVTITPTTSGAGGFTVNIPEKMGLLSKKDIENEIMVLYGGRAAEEILRGTISKITTGASNDIERATTLLKRYFETYGMSSKYGLLDISQYEGATSLNESIELSKHLYQEAYNTLLQNKETLDRIADSLIEKETISGEDLDDIIEGFEIEEGVL